MLLDLIKKLKYVARDSANPMVSKAYIGIENARMPYSFTPTAQVVKDTLEWCRKLSSDFDVVVAVPRSGLLIGSIIATEFGKPLSTPDNFIKSDLWMSTQFEKNHYNTSFYNTILLVDDAILGGTEMYPRLDKIRCAKPNLKVITAALYVYTTRDPKMLVDRYYKVFRPDKTYHYQHAMIHQQAHTLACDMDGVICHDYDGSEYETFIKNAQPYKIPIYPIEAIITARTMQYRAATEKWLREHNVKYNRLYMRRDASLDPLTFKVKALLQEKPYLFWESDAKIAKHCASKTGIRTYCFEDGVLYQ